MKHLKPLSMNPKTVKKIHSNQWIISKGRTDVTNDVRSFSYNERENIMSLTLKEIIQFVHERGLWQSEKCFKTEITEIKGTLIICNRYLYGTKEEQERVHNPVLIDIHPQNKYVGRLYSVDVATVGKELLINHDWIFDVINYEYYLIDLGDYYGETK